MTSPDNNMPLAFFGFLSKNHKEIYTLRNEGLRYKDIALELGIPIGTVRSRLNRARGKLSALSSKSEDV
jgi:DNA-directed RNA polymerase specialized sigma24 family protein